MVIRGFGTFGLVLLLVNTLAACSQFKNDSEVDEVSEEETASDTTQDQERETIWGLFQDVDNPNVTIEVNRFIWQASLEVFDFLPVEFADPFSGVISFGYGTPPGGGTAYRATVYISDPALDARSLRLSLTSRSGPVGGETRRQIEDAILTRARQIRIRTSGL